MAFWKSRVGQTSLKVETEHISSLSPFLPISPTLGSHWSTLSLCRFVYPRNFIYMHCTICGLLVWLLLLSIISRFIHILECTYTSLFIFWSNKFPLYYILCFVYKFINWWTFGLFPFFDYCEWCYEHLCIHFCGCMFLFLLGIHLVMKLLDHMVAHMFHIVWIAKFFPE